MGKSKPRAIYITPEQENGLKKIQADLAERLKPYPAPGIQELARSAVERMINQEIGTDEEGKQ